MKSIFKLRIFRTMVLVFIAILLILSMRFGVYATDSGSCGINATWKIEDEVLTISGSGYMNGYSESSMAPWYDKREQINAVVIENGITNIGGMAFYGFTSLQSIELPSSVQMIGDMAFSGCTVLSRVKLNDGLTTIGTNAFSRCESLKTICIPKTVISIGDQAFYRCTALSSIHIPSNVSNLGDSIFAYCENLMQVIIESPISELPDWTFYGCKALVDVSFPTNMTTIGEYAFFDCDALDSVYHEGEEATRNEVSDQIKQDVPTFGSVTEGSGSDIAFSKTESTTQGSEGEVIKTDREIINSDNSIIDINISKESPADNSGDVHDITIDATIENANGWNELLDVTDRYLEYIERHEGNGNTVNKIDLIVSANYTNEIPKDVLKHLSGKKVNMNISIGSNATWGIDCELLSEDNISNNYNLNFTVKKNKKVTDEQKKLIGNSESFIVEFKETIPFDIKVRVRLGIPYSGDFASIYHKPITSDWSLVQSVIVDDYGYATFYLNSIDTQTKYLVAINVETISIDDVYIPEDLSDGYDGLVDENGIRYEITGTKSKFGLSFMQLTVIMVCIIVVLFVIIGIIVRLLVKSNNKEIKKEELRKRKKVHSKKK